MTKKGETLWPDCWTVRSCMWEEGLGTEGGRGVYLLERPELLREHDVAVLLAVDLVGLTWDLVGLTWASCTGERPPAPTDLSNQPQRRCNSKPSAGCLGGRIRPR